MSLVTNRLRNFVVAIGILVMSCTTLLATEHVTGRAEIAPTLLYAYYTGSIEPLGEGTIIVGDLQSGNINAILPNTFRINGNIIPTSVTKLPGYEGFTGEVYQLTYPIFDFIEWYLPFYDSTLHDYTVTAECDQNLDFTFPGEIMLRGHVSGDVNSDNRVNIADLTQLTSYLFRGGSQLADPGAADMNHNGKITIADVSMLVRRLFAG